MKKIVILSLSILLISGCNLNNEENKFKEKNEEIISDLESIQPELNNSNGDLLLINDISLESNFGILSSEAEHYIIAIPRYEFTNAYIIIKPKKNSEEKVKSSIESYIETLKAKYSERELSNNNLGELSSSNIDYELIKIKIENCKIEEYNGYYIYLMTDKNNEIFSILKEKLN